LLIQCAVQRHGHRLLNKGHMQVVDADLAAYFDSIPNAELMKSAARRVVDRHVLHLIKMWLEVPVEDTDERRRSDPSREPCHGGRRGHRGSLRERCELH
jgi:RNA-directed DNA polymerase